MKKLINEIKYYDEMKYLYDKYKNNIFDVFTIDDITLIINDEIPITNINICFSRDNNLIYIKSNKNINYAILIDKNIYCIKYKKLIPLTNKSFQIYI